MEGCKYCDDNWDNRYSVMIKKNDVFTYGGMQVDNGSITVNVGGHVGRFPVNYCPICGRQLENNLRIKEFEQSN